MEWKYVGRTKRILVIGLLVSGIVLAVFSEFIGKPALVENEKTLKKVTNELSQTKTQTLEIEDELAYTRERKDDFRVLEAAGFFERQERTIVQQAVYDAMRLSGITGGGFKISPASCYVNEDLRDSDYVLLGSQVTLDLESYEDVSIYKFVDFFIRKLPGFIVVENFEVKRTADVTRSLLQQIGTGNKVPIVTSQVEMTWYTINGKEVSVCSQAR